jgi:hypothetical protein
VRKMRSNLLLCLTLEESLADETASEPALTDQNCAEVVDPVTTTTFTNYSTFKRTKALLQFTRL